MLTFNELRKEYKRLKEDWNNVKGVAGINTESREFREHPAFNTYVRLQAVRKELVRLERSI